MHMGSLFGRWKMRRSNWLLIGVAVVLLLAAGGGAWWYASVPHTAEAQFAAAEKVEKGLRAEAVTKTGKDLQPKIDEALEQYRRVWTKYGRGTVAGGGAATTAPASAPADPAKPIVQAEAVKRVAKIHEEIEKDNAKALADLEQLEKDYPDENNAGYALQEEARLIAEAAKALKADNREKADA